LTQRAHLVGVVAVRAQVTTDGARHGGHQHVVDRRAERAPGALDPPELDRLRPRDAVGHVLLALDRRARIRARQQQLGERLRVFDRGRRESCGVPRVQQRLEALVRERAGRARHRLDEAQRRAEGTAAGLGRGDPGGLGPTAIGQREHHARECDPVGDAVVDADEQRTAAAVAVDQVDLPQRSATVQGRGDAIADQLPQRAPVVRSGQRHLVEVRLGVEAGVVVPARPRERRPPDGALAEAVEAPHDPLTEHGTESLPVDRRVEPQDAVDDHQVRRPVHVQPGSIGDRHRVLTSHARNATPPRGTRHSRRSA